MLMMQKTLMNKMVRKRLYRNFIDMITTVPLKWTNRSLN